MTYVYTPPGSWTFRGKGLCGYSFGSLKQKDVEVLYIESETGHDTFMICKGVTRTYYVLGGVGSFTIGGREYRVGPGVLVEVPAGVEYTYSGRMTMLAICKRGWFPRRDKWTRWNRDVVGMDEPRPLDRGSWLSRLVGLRIFGKSPTNAFLLANQWFWNRLPVSVTALRAADSYSHFLHALSRIQAVRAQACSTFFLRNRPELELIRNLSENKKHSGTIRVAVLGCSAGPEVYSIAWAIRTKWPDLTVVMQAVDIEKEAVEFAQRGQYCLVARTTDEVIHDYMAGGRRWTRRPGAEVVGADVFERMTAGEMEDMFSVAGDRASVKDWIREGINWQVGDVRSPEILEQITPQDVVVASNFLCHMEDSEAERCLRNIARLVAPGGCLLVSGISLDVRERVAKDLGWEPVDYLMAEIHEGDPCLRALWPCHYAGLEPIDRKRSDWRIRYAAAFWVGRIAPSEMQPAQQELTHS